jgi:hypothetical protein
MHNNNFEKYQKYYSVNKQQKEIKNKAQAQRENIKNRKEK